MPKKIVPDKELLDKILSLYAETNNYSAVSRAIGLSPTVIKRIIVENSSNDKAFSSSSQDLPVEPKVACTKAQFYYQLQLLVKGEEDDV